MTKKQKRLLKRLTQLLALVIFAVILTGCVSIDRETGQPTGWVYQFLGKPASALLDWLASLFGGSYGIAIIIVTLITRLLMFPSMMSTTKNSMMTTAKMKIAQPEIDAIQAAMKQASPQEQMALNQELRQVYQKYDINMMGGMAGCLPLLIQMPIISAVYFSIRSSQQIINSTFLGIPLGERSILIVVLVVLVYALQGWLMQQGMPQSDNPQAQQTSRSMMLMNPIMLGWMSWISNAGLGIYFLSGGVFAVVQQLITNHIVRPRITALLEDEAKKYENMPKYQPTRRDVTPEDDKRIVPVKQPLQDKRRNEGKQKR